MEDCLFCNLIAGKIPSTKIFEDSDFFAFLDIGPVNKGHVLIVPKEHAETIFAIRPELGSTLLADIQKIGKAVMQATSAKGLNVMQNNYKAAGQEVAHVHWHIIPRHEGDGHNPWTKKQYADTAEMNQLAKAIRKQLA